MKKIILAIALVAASVSAFAGEATANTVITVSHWHPLTVDVDPLTLNYTNEEFQERVTDITIRIRNPMVGYKYTVCAEMPNGLMVGDDAVDVSPKRTGDVLARFYREDGKTPVTPFNCWVTDTPHKPITVKLVISPSKGFVGELNLGWIGFQAFPDTQGMIR